MSRQKYPPPKVVAIDVDGTLFGKSGLNVEVKDWVIKQKENGFCLILWSMRGEQHARIAAEIAGMSDIFDHIISKPGYILDDKGWGWIKFTRVISSL